MAALTGLLSAIDLRGACKRAYLCAFALILFASHAGAEPRNVLVTQAGDEHETRALAGVVRDLLQRLEVAVDIETGAIDPVAIVQRPTTFKPALARVFIDIKKDHAMLYIVDGPWERVLVRRVERSPQHTEVTREEIGHIIETAIEALLSGSRIGIERALLAPKKPSDPRKPKPLPPPKAPEPNVHVGVFQEMMIFANEIPLVSTFGISVALEGREKPNLGAVFSVGYRFPGRTHSQPVGVELQGFEVRVLGRGAVFAAGAFRVDAELGPGIDVLRNQPVANQAQGVVVFSPTVDAFVTARAMLSIRWLSVLALSLGVDIELNHRDYTFDVDGTSTTALSPWRVRPLLMLDAQFL